MAQRTSLSTSLSQKQTTRISPIQIQVVKMIQASTLEFEEKVKQQIEENPALVDGSTMEMDEDGNEDFGRTANPDFDDYTSQGLAGRVIGGEDEGSSREISIEETSYAKDDYDDYSYDYKSKGEEDNGVERYEAPVIQRVSLHDSLTEQMESQIYDEIDHKIATYIIGTIDYDGYFKRDLSDPERDAEKELKFAETRKRTLQSVRDQLGFKEALYVSQEDVERVLKIIQSLDPPGVGARDLQECLLLQIRRKESTSLSRIATNILESHYEDFMNRHYNKLGDRLGITLDKVNEIYDFIGKLNPKPGESESESKMMYIVPDFILTVENEEIIIQLNRRNMPEVRVSKRYLKMVDDLEAETSKEKKSERKQQELNGLKTYVEDARSLVSAIKQRQTTLLNTMSCIARRQRDFFLSQGDETTILPMILQDVAQEIEMDISTVSRVTNSKYVQTDFGIFPLRFFFSEAIETENGKLVSNTVVKRLLEDLISEEDKHSPLSDDDITNRLHEKGFHIARRTVAKYRESMNIPVARLRKRL